MANHGPKYGLTSEVDDARKARYSKEDEADVQAWIEGVTGEKFPGPDFQAYPFAIFDPALILALSLFG